jgi:hypothetical protein
MAGKAYIPGILTGLGENDHQNTTHVRNNTSSVVDASNGEMYLASSDTEPDKPYRRGFSVEEQSSKPIHPGVSSFNNPMSISISWHSFTI